MRKNAPMPDERIEVQRTITADPATIFAVLSDPAIYDTGKSQLLEPKDRLRMPRPFLTKDWRDGLTTLLLGSVGPEGANVPAASAAGTHGLTGS